VTGSEGAPVQVSAQLCEKQHAQWQPLPTQLLSAGTVARAAQVLFDEVALVRTAVWAAAAAGGDYAWQHACQQRGQWQQRQRPVRAHADGWGTGGRGAAA
jgi:hypothetical protein